MRPPKQLALDIAPPASYAAEDLVRGAPNEAALGLLERWPDWPGSGIVLFGPPGSGKTHLAHIWCARAGARRMTAAELGPARADAPLAIEDVDRGVDEHALLHLYNRFAEAGRHLLLTARTAPARWAIALPDLRSRLLSLPAAELLPPDDLLLRGALRKQFADRRLKVDEQVISYLLARMDRSFAAATVLVREIDALSLSARREITLPLAAQALRATGE